MASRVQARGNTGISSPYIGIDSVARLTDRDIAEYLWLDSRAIISSDMVAKVNTSFIYLHKLGFQLNGIKADGNCFCNAFLKSYATLSRRSPLLDASPNKISFLRDTIGAKMELKGNGDRAKEIRRDGGWLAAFDEGDLLAKAFSIPIRIITVNKDADGCGLSDALTFPDKECPTQDWETLQESEKPEEYVLIVDLGGHFIYADHQLSSLSRKINPPESFQAIKMNENKIFPRNKEKEEINKKIQDLFFKTFSKDFNQEKKESLEFRNGKINLAATNLQILKISTTFSNFK
jgi:hypothetical protein